MSDTINTIIDKEAFDQVSRLATDVKNLRLELVEVIRLGANPKKINIQLPADLQKQTEGYIKNIKQIETVQQKEAQTISKLQAEVKKLQAARKSSAKTLSLEEKLARKKMLANERLAESQSEVGKEIQRTRNEATQNNRVTRQMETFYGKISLKLKKTAQEYKDLSLRKQILNDLTEEEIRKMTMLEARLDKYSDALMQADARTGNYSRNVGNYKSGFDGLAMSMAQLTREGPAFAYSMQTGFLAISNNLPILVDEINNLKQANAELIAQGKPAQNIFKQIGAALFSWQTALSIGITLLTIYGKEIATWVSELFEGKQQLDATAESQRLLNEAMKDTNYSQAVKDISELRIALEMAKNGVIDKQEAIDLYNESLGAATESAESLEDVEQGLIDNAESYVQMMFMKAAANLALEEASKKALEAAKASRQDEEDFMSEWDKWQQENFSGGGMKLGESAAIEAFNEQKRKEARQERKEFISEMKEDQKTLEEIAEGFLKEAAKSAKEISATLFGDGPDDADKEESNPGERAKVEAVWQEKVRDTLEGTIAAYEEQISVLEYYRKELATTSKEHRFITESIGKLKTAISTLKNEFDVEDLILFDDEEIQAQLEGLQNHLSGKIPAAMENLADLLGEDTRSLMEEFAALYEWDYENFLKFSQQKIAQTEFESEAKKEKLAEWMKTASDVIYNIGGLFSAIQDRKIQKIEDEIKAKDKLLESDRLSEEQRKLIEEEKAKLEEKKRQQEEKAAKTRKAFAMFDIAINTAAAIVKTLPNIPLSIAMGVIGALQLAMVAAKPIPQYKTGRKNGEAEWAILGDGGKKEPVSDQSGNLKMISPNTPTLMKLDKGDRVFPSEEAYRQEYQNINDAAVMASLTLGQSDVSAYEAVKTFDQQLMRAEIKSGIKEGFRNIQVQSINKNINNNDALLYELKRQRLRDV